MFSPSDLYEIRKIVVAAKLLDSGAFDAELAKIEDGIKAAADAQVAAQEATNAKFVAQAAQMQDELDAKEATLQNTLADIVARSAALDEKQAAYNTTSADVGAKLDALAVLQKTTQEMVDAAKNDVAERLNVADEREQALAVREAALAQGQQDLAAKLAALKSLSA